MIFSISNDFSKIGRVRDLHIFREAPNQIERARMFVSNLGYLFLKLPLIISLIFLNTDKVQKIIILTIISKKSK